MRGSLAALLLLHVIVACGAGDAASKGSRSAGSLTETLRIGSARGEGPAAFADIRSLEVDRLGRIYILESQAQEIRVFDSSGHHVRTIGRKGQGPGEFQQALD